MCCMLSNLLELLYEPIGIITEQLLANFDQL
ncbi:hypothetical protein SAMN04487786_2446 [Paenisporosarcina quisquiliarum]|nr:hypothetical protein SAMN04487786_2446 [Paenisporosarcina quisquiliarum]